MPGVVAYTCNLSQRVQRQADEFGARLVYRAKSRICQGYTETPNKNKTTKHAWAGHKEEGALERCLVGNHASCTA